MDRAVFQQTIPGGSLGLSLVWPDDLLPGQVVRVRDGDGTDNLLLIVGKELDCTAHLRTHYLFVSVPAGCREGESLAQFRREALAAHGWAGLMAV